MQIPVSSSPKVFVTIYGPAGCDLSEYPVSIAIVGETAGEPAIDAYEAADWTWADPKSGRGTACILVAAGTYPPGDYMAYALLTASDGEAPVIQSGRIRIGDGVSPAGTPGAPAATWVTTVNGQAGTVTLPAGGTLTGGASIAVDADGVTDLAVTLTENATLQNPPDLEDWQILRFHVRQGPDGPFLLSYGTVYNFGAQTPPVLSTTPGKVDIIGFQFDPVLGELCYCGFLAGY
jgi:hypothetical protein